MRISVLTPSIRPKGLEIVQKCLKSQTFQDFEWLVEVGLGNKHDLNAAYNRMLRRAQGDIIVFYQDYIKVPDDFLLKISALAASGPHTFPVGKVKSLDYEGEVKWDWRHIQSKEIDWLHWEIDLACSPKKALFEVGGFDEALDEYWSFDNVNLGFRLDQAGYKFFNTTITEGIAYDHDSFEEHPFRKDYNPSFHNERLDEFRRGLKLNYLPTSEES